MELLAIFRMLKVGLNFTFTISVTGTVDHVNVGYASITMGICVDEIRSMSASGGALANCKQYNTTIYIASREVYSDI